MTIKRQKRTPLMLNLMVLPAPSHLNPANWASPNDRSSEYKTIDYWVEIAQLAEKAKFNAVFIADVLGPYDVYNGPHNIDAVARSGAQFPLVDPSAYVSAMAAATSSVGFGVTFSTISEPPYLFARRIATLDHLSKGRIGWNIVTSYLKSAARNLLQDGQLPSHDKRYEKAEEYLQVVYKLLLSSWRDDAAVVDAKTLTYAEPSRIREINHQGEYYNVPGPFITEPSPQRLPVLLQAGASAKGRDFAARNAEVVFIVGFSPEELKESIDAVKEIAKSRYNRDTSDIRFISELQIILGETHVEAEKKFQELLKYHHSEGKQALLGGWTGVDFSKFADDQDLELIGKSDAMLSAVNMYIKNNKTKTKSGVAHQVGVGNGRTRLFVGTAKEVADNIEDYVERSGIDGFNFVSSTFPQSFKDIVEYLVPELRSRGLLWNDYPVPGGTFRENLYGHKGQTFVPKDHIAQHYRWTSGTNEEFTKKFEAFTKSTAQETFDLSDKL